MAVTAAELRAVLRLQDELSPKLGAVMKSIDGVGRAAKSAGDVAKSAGSGFQSMTSAAGGLGSALKSGLGMGLGFGAVGAVVSGVGAAFGAAKGSVIDLNSSLEQSQIAFSTMLGSGEQATAFLGDLQKFAANTPFEFPELVDASKRMLAFGFNSEQVVPLLTAVGDAVAAVGGGSETIDGVTTAIGQMQAKGKVSAEEMGQLAERGIPAWDMLAKHMGVSVAEAMDAVSKGQVKAGTFVEAFQKGSAERFGGMMAAQSKTFAGAMSTIKDSLGMATATAFKPFFGLLSEGAVALAGFLQGETFTSWANAAAAAIDTTVKAARDLFDIFGGGDSFDGATDALSKILPPAVVDFIVEGARQLGDAWRTVQQVFAGEWAASDQIDPFVNAVGSIAVVIRDQVIPAVTTFATFVMEQLGTVVAWVSENMPLILATFQTVWGGLVTVVQAVWPLIQNSISTSVGVILGLVKTLMQVLTGDWQGAMDSLAGVASTAWEGVKTAFGLALPLLGSLIDAATGGWLTAITTWASDTYMAVTTWVSDTQAAISGAMTAIGEAFTNGWNAVKAFVGSILPAIRTAILAIWNLLPEDIRRDLVLIATHITTQGAVWLTNITTAGQNMLTAITTKLGEMVTALTTWATQTFVQPIMDMVGPVGEQAAAVGGGMLTAISTKLGEIIAAVTTWADTTFLAPLRGLVATARTAAENIGNAIVEGIRGSINGAVESVASAAATMVRRALQAAKNAVGIPGDAGVNVDVGDLEGRAAGGLVSMGLPYVVGERGPELFVPGADGSILTAGATASLLDGTSGGSTGRGSTAGGREIHVHLEGAQIYGFNDFENAVQQAVGRGLKRGRLG